MNPFDRFGIKHLSPSALATYRNEPAMWVMRYLFGFKDETGLQMARGKAVEEGVTWGLHFAEDIEESVRAALQAFTEETQGDLSEEAEKERECIPGMVRQALASLRLLGKPNATQVKVETWFDGIEVPVLGYVDYAFESGDVDLKTTLAVPTKGRPDHVAQVAVYHHARKRPQTLLYVSAKKANPIEVPLADMEGALWAVKQSAKALRTALLRSTCREEVAELCAPRLDSYYWNDQSRAAALEIWR